MKMIPIEICKRQLKNPYYVTDTGEIYTEIYQRFLSKTLDRDGYQKVCLVSTDNKRHRYSVHRLVLENFYPVANMHQLQVNHIDGDKTNNALSNLEWCTCQDNITHAVRNNLRHSQIGEKNNGAKVSEQDVLNMIDMYLNQGINGVAISRLYGLSDDYFGTIKRKLNWTHLTKDIDFNRRFND